MRTVKPSYRPERYLDTDGDKSIDLLTVEGTRRSADWSTWAAPFCLLSFPFFIVLPIVLSVVYGPFDDGIVALGSGFFVAVVSFLIFKFLDQWIGSNCRVTLYFYGGGIEQFKNKARDHDAIYKALRERFHDHDGCGWQCPHPLCTK